MKVKGWDGYSEEVETYEDAVQAVKDYLQEWKQKGDRILWFSSVGEPDKPNVAFIVNEVGERTDASAMILED
jgi:hypothetical protein